MASQGLAGCDEIAAAMRSVAMAQKQMASSQTKLLNVHLQLCEAQNEADGASLQMKEAEHYLENVERKWDAIGADDAGGVGYMPTKKKRRVTNDGVKKDGALVPPPPFGAGAPSIGNDLTWSVGNDLPTMMHLSGLAGMSKTREGLPVGDYCMPAMIGNPIPAMISNPIGSVTCHQQMNILPSNTTMDSGIMSAGSPFLQATKMVNDVFPASQSSNNLDRSTTRHVGFKNPQQMSFVKHMQKRLAILFHASQCNSSSGNRGGQCKVKCCAAIKNLLKHISSCKDSRCKVQHCLSSRYMMTHYRDCKKNLQFCTFCDPVRKSIQVWEEKRHRQQV